MTNTFTIALVAALSMTTFGCKKKGGGDALAKMEGFQKDMCDCKDKACADKVNADMTKWGTEMAKTADKDAKPDPDMAKKSADVMTKYTECMTKLMMGGAGGGAAAGGGGEPAAPAGGGKDCPAGATKNEAAGFCVKLPDGFKALAEQKVGSEVTYRYRNADKNQELEVSIRKGGDYDALVKDKQKWSDEHKGQTGDIPNGKWWMYDEENDTHTESVTKNAAGTIACGTAIGKNDSTKAEVIDLCKSLTAL